MVQGGIDTARLTEQAMNAAQVSQRVRAKTERTDMGRLVRLQFTGDITHTQIPTSSNRTCSNWKLTQPLTG